MSTQDFTYRHYTLTWVWGTISPEQRQAVVNFWLQEGALTNRDAAEKRSHQVAYIAWNSYRQIAGICTAYLSRMRQKETEEQDKFYFMYRSFIRKVDRVGFMSTVMLAHTTSNLKEMAPSMRPTPSGVAVVAENPKLAKAGMQRMGQKLGFELVGRTAKKQQVTYIHAF